MAVQALNKTPVTNRKASRKAAHADAVREFQDIPNIGPAMSGDFAKLGIRTPRELARQDPFVLYARLQRVTGVYQDPCVCDTFIAAVRFMQGGPAVPWWHYTAERKRHFND